ncbi:MAG: hypothetical protein FOGNACKC_02224 [Anaerolineae bacterium]|nr:hypothetical protein [Anaerolineae bacterium]
MATPILTQILNLINLGHPLAAAVEAVVPGADVAYWQRQLNRPAAAKKSKRKNSKRSNSRKPSKRINYAAQVTARGQAMAELVERANGTESRSVLVNLPEGYRLVA